MKKDASQSELFASEPRVEVNPKSFLNKPKPQDPKRGESGRFTSARNAMLDVLARVGGLASIDEIAIGCFCFYGIFFDDRHSLHWHMGSLLARRLVVVRTNKEQRYYTLNKH
jgi:hypothetical protein